MSKFTTNAEKLQQLDARLLTLAYMIERHPDSAVELSRQMHAAIRLAHVTVGEPYRWVINAMLPAFEDVLALAEQGATTARG